jgi:cytochrome c-type biogenesis protein
MHSSDIPLLAAFLAGLLSFISPCVLPLTPVYLARLAGPAIWEASKLEGRQRVALRLTTTLHAVSFVAGFAAVFIILGATASVLGRFLSEHIVPLRQVGGIALAVFGLHVAGLLRIPILNRERRPTLRPGGSGYPASFLVGLVFGLGWTPCVGPVLTAILLLASQAGTLNAGVLLLFVYSLGLGLPFLALGAAFDRLAPTLKRLTPYARTIELLTGALLVLMGIVIYFNWLLVINGHLSLPA